MAVPDIALVPPALISSTRETGRLPGGSVRDGCLIPEMRAAARWTSGGGSGGGDLNCGCRTWLSTASRKASKEENGVKPSLASGSAVGAATSPARTRLGDALASASRRWGASCSAAGKRSTIVPAKRSTSAGSIAPTSGCHTPLRVLRCNRPRKKPIWGVVEVIRECLSARPPRSASRNWRCTQGDSAR